MSLFFRTLYSQNLVAALLIVLLVSIGSKVAANETTAAPSGAIGYLDTISLIENKILAQGWVAPVDPSRKVVALVIRFDDTKVYEGRFEKYERSDVVVATARNDLINSGWRVESEIPWNLKAGKYTVTVQVKIDSGEIIELPVHKKTSIIEINPNQSNHQTLIMVVLGLLVCVLLVIAAFYFAETASSKLTHLIGRTVHPSAIVAFALAFLFIFLVGMGTTGSSLEVGIKQSPFISSDSIHIWGEPKPIRSDEWLVFTPLALAQANHAPTFPVINKNVGEDGQNMLIIGMTGAPVSHVSAFAKPATWGFHVFDLKRGLSWYWWFPIFGCLFALWAVFSLVTPNYWRIGVLFSLLFCASSYVSAWSYWPAYGVFFACLMLYASISILRTKNKISLLSWSVLLGLSLAGFVLILYPPWQVSLGYLFLLIGIGIVLRDKLYLNINTLTLLAFAIAIGLATGILWAWWTDANSAIINMMNTVYPGQRDSVVGGSMNASDLFRGFTNLITLYRIDGRYSNQSEIASFYYFFPSLIILFGIRIWEKRLNYVHYLLLLFLIFVSAFMLIGMPYSFTSLSLWGRVPAQRADLSLGLAYILLIAALLVPDKVNSKEYKTPIRVFAAIASLIYGLVVIYALSKIPNDILFGFSPSVVVAIFLVLVVGSWWLALGDYRKFIALSLALSLVTVLPFNPMVIAPNTIAPINDFARKHSRVLLANTQVPAMLLLASGYSVSNGIFYYPQKTMWDRLDPTKSQTNIYNRYQHLIFTLGSVEAPYYRIESPQTDVVRVIVDSTHFDFKKTGADLFIAPSNDLNTLKLNTSLKLIEENNGWSSFAITGIDNK